MATFAARPTTTKAPSRKRTEQPGTSAPPAVDGQIRQEDIATRAFEKFATRGYVHGFDEQDWFDAEEELIAEYRDRQ